MVQEVLILVNKNSIQQFQTKSQKLKLQLKSKFTKQIMNRRKRIKGILISLWLKYVAVLKKKKNYFYGKLSMSRTLWLINIDLHQGETCFKITDLKYIAPSWKPSLLRKRISNGTTRVTSYTNVWIHHKKYETTVQKNQST